MAEKFDTTKVIAIVTLAVSSVVGGGASLHDAVTPDRMHPEDHDRLVRIEEWVLLQNGRIDDIETEQDDHDTKLDAHGERLAKVETRVDDIVPRKRLEN